MKKYLTFIKEDFTAIQPNEKGILTIEVGDEASSNEKWKMLISLESNWKQYANNSISIVDFNNMYASTLMENQQKISTTVGDACWNEIEPIISDDLRKATNTEDSEIVYDNLYDIFDKYEIYIETGKQETELHNESFEQQDYAEGDIVSVKFNGEEKVARISKINSKFSYLIQIEDNTAFLPHQHEINRTQIIKKIKGNNDPALASDWNQKLQQPPSNDFAISGNGTPGVAAPGVPFRSH